jgi:hypothetical protein
MRRVLLAVFMTLIVIGATAELSMAQFTPGTAGSSTDARASTPEPALASSQYLPGQTVVVAQNTTPKPSDKGKKPKDKSEDKEKKKIPNRASNYKCMEYCAVVRQSCEVLATVQPISRIADVGSKENNEWSKKVQKIYTECINKCDFDEDKVHWKRYVSKEQKKNKK